MIDSMMEIKVQQYGTTKEDCRCPDYLYRQARVGGQCKHMKYIEQRDQDTIIKRESELKFNPDDFKGKGMDMGEAGDKYTDDILKDWSKTGRIFLDRKRMRWRLL